jgi:thiol-disulfide isomerase/thioredoxin
MESDDVIDLPHDGQVWLLDFWATWCPPCQAPMAHNQKMLEENPDWEGKIKIIGLSIDQDKTKLKNHVDAKGWGKVEHYFRGTSDASTVYGVNGVPHVMLIDKTGKIVFKGHPANRPDLKGDMEKLANGEMPAGLGGATGGAGGEEEKKSNVELSLDECLN